MSYPPLSAQTLRYLQQLQQRLNTSGSARVKTSVKSTQQVLRWCIEHELVPGNSLKLNKPVTTELGITAEFTDSDWQQLPLAQFDALLVVENLDCFYQLDAFKLALPYQQTLIIYRGDKLYSKGCQALIVAWQHTSKPSIYFGDADLAGLSIALSLQCHSMLLPSSSDFRQHASPAMLADSQIKYQQRLLQMKTNPAFLPTFTPTTYPVKHVSFSYMT